MAGAFDDVYLDWRRGLYCVIQELRLSGGCDLILLFPPQARIGKRTPSSAPGTLKKSVAGAKSTSLPNRLSEAMETQWPARVLHV